MTQLHPTDRTLAKLVDGYLDAATEAAARIHVAGCQRCQLRAALSHAGDWPDSPIPSFARVSVDIAEVRDEDPAHGDVWRLTWDAIIILAVVWQTGADRIGILPLVETCDADEWCARLPAAVTGLGEIAVSVASETEVPWSVLDARVDHLTDMDSVVRLRSAYRTGVDAESVARGEAVHSPLDERLLALDVLKERLVELAEAAWMPLVAEATDRTFDFDSLVSAGLPPNRALAIARGATPSEEEADAIEAGTGRRPTLPPIPEDLRRTIDLPVRKLQIRERAVRNQRSEAAERLDLARRAEPALAAARGTYGHPPDYDTVLNHLLGE